MNYLASICNYYQNLEDLEYVSITDMSKNVGKSTMRWIRAKQTIAFITEWESYHNEDFKPLEEGKERNITFKEWIESTNSIGIVIDGKNVIAHKDIAMQFQMWADPLFFLYIVKTMTTKVEKCNFE